MEEKPKKAVRRPKWTTKLKSNALKTEIARDIVVKGVAEVVHSLAVTSIAQLSNTARGVLPIISGVST